MSWRMKETFYKGWAESRSIRCFLLRTCVIQERRELWIWPAQREATFHPISLIQAESKQSLCSFVSYNFSAFPNDFGSACEVKQIAPTEIRKQQSCAGIQLQIAKSIKHLRPLLHLPHCQAVVIKNVFAVVIMVSSTVPNVVIWWTNLGRDVSSRPSLDIRAWIYWGQLPKLCFTRTSKSSTWVPMAVPLRRLRRRVCSCKAIF